MNFTLIEKERTKQKIAEAIFEYAAACHVENIVKEMEEKYGPDEHICFPDELDAKMRKLIDSYDKKARRKKALSTFKKTFPKVAVFFIVILSAIVICAMGVEAIRVTLLNFITDQTKQYTNVEIKEQIDSQEIISKTIPNNWEGLYAPTYIPEGFVIYQTNNYTNTDIIIYLNSITDQMIIFEQSINKKTNLRADTESGNVDKIMINHFEGLLVNKNGKYIIMWHNDDISFSISGEIDIDIDELIKIAESVKMIE